MIASPLRLSIAYAAVCLCAPGWTHGALQNQEFQDIELQAKGGQKVQQTENWIDRTLWNANLRPDSRGSLGTPAGPVLELDKVRLAIDYRRVEYDGLQDGGDELSPEQVLDQGFFRVPKSGSLEVTELRGEYGVSENATLRLHVPLEKRSVSYLRADGESERHNSLGLGDVRLSGAVELSFRDQERLELHLGAKVPTGSVREREGSPTGSLASPRLPYAQQLGGGTYALEPGLYWTRWTRDWSFGVGGKASLPTGTNSQGWSLGDSFRGQLWVARRVDPFRAVNFSLEYSGEDAVQGRDASMEPEYDPTESPFNVGGQTVSASIGLHMEVERGNHLGLEIGVPVWQDLHGPQLDERFGMRVGWWLAF